MSWSTAGPAPSPIPGPAPRYPTSTGGSPGYAPPGYAPPGYGQPAYAPPGTAQPGYPGPVSPHPYPGQPAYGAPTWAPGPPPAPAPGGPARILGIVAALVAVATVAASFLTYYTTTLTVAKATSTGTTNAWAGYLSPPGIILTALAGVVIALAALGLLRGGIRWVGVAGLGVGAVLVALSLIVDPPTDPAPVVVDATVSVDVGRGVGAYVVLGLALLALVFGVGAALLSGRTTGAAAPAWAAGYPVPGSTPPPPWAPPHADVPPNAAIPFTPAHGIQPYAGGPSAPSPAPAPAAPFPAPVAPPPLAGPAWPASAPPVDPRVDEARIGAPSDAATPQDGAAYRTGWSPTRP